MHEKCGWEKQDGRLSLYISIDKDVLCPADAQTTWSQGDMRLDTLLSCVQTVRECAKVCQAVIAHLAARKETRWHSFGENTDYPQQSEEWMKYVNSRMENGEIKILYRDLITKENTGLNTAEKGAGER